MKVGWKVGHVVRREQFAKALKAREDGAFRNWKIIHFSVLTVYH